MFFHPNLSTAIQTCKCVWQYFIVLSKESVRSVGVGNSFSAVLMLFFQSKLATNVSCYEWASSLSSNWALTTSGMRSGLVQEEAKSVKSRLVLENDSFCGGFQRRKWKKNPSLPLCSMDTWGDGIVLFPLCYSREFLRFPLAQILWFWEHLHCYHYISFCFENVEGVVSYLTSVFMRKSKENWIYVLHD